MSNDMQLLHDAVAAIPAISASAPAATMAPETGPVKRTPDMTQRVTDVAVDSGIASSVTVRIDVVRDIAAVLNPLLADVFALYLKTKSFHWHISGPHFRDYHLLLDEHASALLAISDPLAERIRKLGATTLRSIGHMVRLQRIGNDEREMLDAVAMLKALRRDNAALASSMRAAHTLCEQHSDVATASLLEGWIDDAEGRVWFLSETLR